MGTLSKGRKIAIYALTTAIVTVATMVIKIPSVSTGGYINFGDTFILIFAVMLGGSAGLVCGGLGSALADILSGYAVWAPFTLVIKGLEGLACGYLAAKFLKKDFLPFKKFYICLAAMLAAALIMVVGYFFATAILVGSFKVALVALLENIVQGGVSVIIALFILFSLKFLIKFKL